MLSISLALLGTAFILIIFLSLCKVASKKEIPFQKRDIDNYTLEDIKGENINETWNKEL